MPIFRVYGIMTASKLIGEYEAGTKEDAIWKAQEDGDYHASICHQCADEIELGDIYEEQAEEI